MSSSSDDDTPLVAVSSGVGSHNQQNGTAGARSVNGKRRKASSSDFSDDDRPLVGFSMHSSNYRADYIPTTQAKRVKPAPAASKKKANNSEETSDDEDDVPLASRTTKVPMPGAHAAAVGARPNKSPRRSAAKSYKEESDDDGLLPPVSSKASQDDEEQPSDSSDDGPLVKRTPKRVPATNGKAKNTIKKRKKSEDSSESDSTETETNKKAKKAKPPPKKRVKKEVKDEDEMDVDEGGVKSKSTSPTKKESKAKAPKAKKEEKEEEIFKWWEEETPDDIEGDGSKKWDTLQHSGVLFPPPYVPAPASVKILYDGESRSIIQATLL